MYKNVFEDYNYESTTIFPGAVESNPLLLDLFGSALSSQSIGLCLISAEVISDFQKAILFSWSVRCFTGDYYAMETTIFYKTFIFTVFTVLSCQVVISCEIFL